MQLRLVLTSILLGGCLVQQAPAASPPPYRPPPPPARDPLEQQQAQIQSQTQPAVTRQPIDQPPARPVKLVKLAPYQLEWMKLPPSYVFSKNGTELLYVDAGRGALLAAPLAGGAARDVYVGKVGHVHHELEEGDALVLVDEKFSTHGNDYNEHYRRVVVSSGSSSEIGRDMPADVRMTQDSGRFRSAGVDNVQPFRVGRHLAGQTPAKELVVLEAGKVASVCASPGSNVAWPEVLGDGRRLAQPAVDRLFIADVVTHTCVRTDEQLPPSTFVYPVLAGSDDGTWLLYASSAQTEVTLLLADARGHAKVVARLPGAIGVRPVALPRTHTFIYAASWQTAERTAATVFYELNADTNTVERRTCDLTMAIDDSTAPEFALSPDGHTIAVAISGPSPCGISESGLYDFDVSGR